MADYDNGADHQPLDDPGSLEVETTSEQVDGGAPAAAATESSIDSNPVAPAPPESPHKPSLVKRLRTHHNIYIWLFVLIIIIGVSSMIIAYRQVKHGNTTGNGIQAQSLSQSTLQQLANSDTSVGSSQSVLNVQSSAVFAGQVLVKQTLEVAGDLQIGGTVALTNLAVAGASQFGQATVNKNLSVAGDTALQGTATIAKNLQVSGSGTFNGALSAPQITTSSLQLNGNLELTHHISVGGSTPARSAGSALGSGGTASVSGADTAGSITIGTGSNPSAGCFVTVIFTTPFNSTPHVLVTPVGSAAGGLSYYVNRSTTSFSICDAATPPAGSSFGFDYFVLD